MTLTVINPDTIIAILISIPVGIACSMIAWWVLFHLISPKLEISHQITKRQSKGSPTDYRYYVKIENVGRRAAFDIQIQSAIQVIYEKTEVSVEQKSMRLNPSIDHISVLEAGQSTSFFIYPDDDKARNYLLSDFELDLDEIISLEHLLDCSSESRFKLSGSSFGITIFASDSFSGARKAFISERYSLTDIIED